MKKLIFILLLLPLFVNGQFFNYYTSASVSWKPTDISGCNLWLDAGQGITKDGSNYISEWADQSGNGNDCLQNVGSAQPLFVASALNGEPVVRLDGGSDYLYRAYSPSYIKITEQPFTVFVVWSIDVSPPSTSNVIISDEYSAGYGFTLMYNQPNENIYYWGSTDLGNYLAPTKPFTIINTIVGNGINSYLYENGTQKLNGNSGTEGIRGLFIGISGGSLNYNAKIDVAEIIIYNSALDDTNRGLVEDYLNTKYNIY